MEVVGRERPSTRQPFTSDTGEIDRPVVGLSASIWPNRHASFGTPRSAARILFTPAGLRLSISRARTACVCC
jgi:hypothetical protein